MEKEILIEGMQCRHCSEFVTKALSNVSGVNSVNVDLDKNIAVVDVSDVKDEILFNAIKDLGYEVKNITEH